MYICVHLFVDSGDLQNHRLGIRQGTLRQQLAVFICWNNAIPGKLVPILIMYLFVSVILYTDTEIIDLIMEQKVVGACIYCT